MKQLIQSSTITVLLILIITVALVSGCQQQKPEPSKELKPIIDKYHEVWNGGNLEDLDSIIDSNFIYHSNQDPDVNGIEGIKKVILSIRTAYPDVKLNIRDALFSENKEASRWVLTGTNTGSGEMPPTGKSVKIWGESIIHIANGKINEEWVAFDNKSLMEQLGFKMILPKEK